MCPSAQNLVLRLKLSPSLMSNTKCPVISLNPGSCVISPSCSWNAILLFIISRSIVSIQGVLSLSLSMDLDSSQVFGTRIPYLCVLYQYLDFNFDIILCRFLSVYGIHQANASCSSILFITAYPASSIGYESFKSLSETQSDDPSYYRTQISHPLVVLFS